MNCEELVAMHLALAVTAIYMEENRPEAKDMTAAKASEYIQELLGHAFSPHGIVFTVRPLAYPKCSKIPIIISLKKYGTRLLWFHPEADAGTIVRDLEETLSDLIERVSKVSA